MKTTASRFAIELKQLSRIRGGSERSLEKIFSVFPRDRFNSWRASVPLCNTCLSRSPVLLGTF